MLNLPQAGIPLLGFGLCKHLLNRIKSIFATDPYRCVIELNKTRCLKYAVNSDPIDVQW